MSGEESGAATAATQRWFTRRSTQNFNWAPPEDFYLAVGELVAYKRLDYAVRWFSASGRRLRIVGSGPEYARLKTMANSKIEFCGHVSDAELRRLYAQCRALLLPGEEDFGITAVEATASGKPVIALGRGGVLDSVPAEGLFPYAQPTESHLAAAVEALKRSRPGCLANNFNNRPPASRKPSSPSVCVPSCAYDIRMA